MTKHLLDVEKTRGKTTRKPSQSATFSFFCGFLNECELFSVTLYTLGPGLQFFIGASYAFEK